MPSAFIFDKATGRGLNYFTNRQESEFVGRDDVILFFTKEKVAPEIQVLMDAKIPIQNWKAAGKNVRALNQAELDAIAAAELAAQLQAQAAFEAERKAARLAELDGATKDSQSLDALKFDALIETLVAAFGKGDSEEVKQAFRDSYKQKVNEL